MSWIDLQHLLLQQHPTILAGPEPLTHAQLTQQALALAAGLQRQSMRQIAVYLLDAGDLAVAYALTHDMLTGLYNRKEFVRLSKLELENNPSTDYALIRLNIVDFKKINVSYGYDIGDLVIKKIASYFIDDHY